eukprot:COSAG01_NODE_1000_length_12213_cov_20.853063_15_plen_69_part_00
MSAWACGGGRAARASPAEIKQFEWEEEQQSANHAVIAHLKLRPTATSWPLRMDCRVCQVGCRMSTNHG